jgi:predicted DNA-binding protein
MSTHVKQVSFRFTHEVRQALDAIKERDGIPLSEQLRRAVALWIATKALPAPAAATTPRKRRG